MMSPIQENNKALSNNFLPGKSAVSRTVTSKKGNKKGFKYQLTVSSPIKGNTKYSRLKTR